MSVRVVAVGVRSRQISDDEYRTKLREWTDEARGRGAYEQVMSEEEITAEVARASDSPSFAINEFAVLEDGGRVWTDDDRDGTFGIQLAAFGSPAGAGNCPPLTTDVLHSQIRSVVLEKDVSPEERWGRLVQALARQGISTEPTDLDSLPFSVEITPQS